MGSHNSIFRKVHALSRHLAKLGVASALKWRSDTPCASQDEHMQEAGLQPQ